LAKQLGRHEEARKKRIKRKRRRKK